MTSHFYPLVRPLKAVSSLAVAAAVLLAGPGAARAVVIRDDVPASAYQTLAGQSQFDGVGLIIIDSGHHRDQNEGQVAGTGTIINKNYILTAAHVVSQEALRGANRVYFRVKGVTYPINFKTKGVIKLAPNYLPAQLLQHGGANDIAVVRLSRPTHITPAKLYAGRAESGQLGTMVGYGQTGTGVTGEVAITTFFNTGTPKLAGQNTIDQVYAGVLKTDFDSPTTPSFNVMGSATPLALEAQVGHGDSGGPLMIQVNGVWAIAGVNDYTEPGNDLVEGGYGSISGFTRVSSYLKFIQSACGIKTVGGPPPKKTKPKKP